MRENDQNRMWKLVLAYDGTEFRGWQFQPGLPTIQGELRAAIERVTGEDVLPQGSGRTDAGVHALGQVASFALSARIPEPNLLRALNRTLPAAIRVLSAELAADDFHARHSAKAKTYEYRIFCERFALRGWPAMPMRSISRSISKPCSAPPCGFSANVTSPPLPPAIRKRRSERLNPLHPKSRPVICEPFTPPSGLPRSTQPRPIMCRSSSIACGEMASFITWCATWWGHSFK